MVAMTVTMAMSTDVCSIAFLLVFPMMYLVVFPVTVLLLVVLPGAFALARSH